MLDSGAPDIQKQIPKSLKNVTCEHAQQKSTFLCPSNQQISKCDPEIHPQSTEIEALTPIPAFLCFEVPLDLSMVPQGAKVDAASMPNDTFWHQN